MCEFPVADLLRPDIDPGETLIELQRLLLCYQAASPDDKNTIWSALNKYAKFIDGLA